MALTVGVATVLDSREVVIAVTGLRKALALSKGIGAPVYCALIDYFIESHDTSEEGINHLVSSL